MKKCPGCKKIKEIKDFHNRKITKDRLSYYCKECARGKRNDHNNTEKGFLLNSYSSMKKKTISGRFKNSPEHIKQKHDVNLKKEEFFELWEQHKNKHGYKCTLTGVEMILKRKKNIGGTIGYENGFSVDRLNPNIGYTKENIIFITNMANKLKNAVTKELCVSILKAYEERGW
jgi:hypothetical protein